MFIMLRLIWSGVMFLTWLQVTLSLSPLSLLICLDFSAPLGRSGRRGGRDMKPLILLAGMRPPARDRCMALPPITEELWRSAVRSKPVRTSTGLDGLSWADMAAMPSDLLQLILQLCSHAEATGVVSALEKRVGAEVVGDYRPITVLSLLYRTWSSIQSRQALAYLSELAPAGMYGNLGGRTASQLWFGLQLQLEEARYAGVGVVGAIADLEKAFNLLPRTPVMAAARAVGIAEPILIGWCGALSSMRRHFRIRGSVGPGLHSCTGFPEGCGLSCLAMALVDLSLHCHMSRACPQVEVLTYVDNWELQARQVASLIECHQALVDFTRSWDLRLDESKTLMWGTARQDCRALRALGHAVCLDVRDLGGHAQFSSRASNFTVVERLDRLHLRTSFSCHKHKRATLPVAAWPKGLHGIAGVAVGSQHFDRLRAGAMAVPVLEAALSVTGRRHVGPVGVLLDRWRRCHGLGIVPARSFVMSLVKFASGMHRLKNWTFALRWGGNVRLLVGSAHGVNLPGFGTWTLRSRCSLCVPGRSVTRPCCVCP